MKIKNKQIGKVREKEMVVTEMMVVVVAKLERNE